MPQIKGMDKRLPAAARTHNKAMLLSLLYPSQELSRADFAKASGLTRGTVSEIATELIDEGFIAEVGYGESGGPGKKGMLLTFVASSRNVIALDLSMPYLLRGAVMDLNGHILLRDELTYVDKGEENLALVDQLCQRLIEKALAPILGLGVACPGIVTREGVVRTSMNLGWHNVDLKGHLCREFKLPVSVNNDANDAVFAEYQFGQGSPDMLLIQLTQGFGAGMLIGGEINGWTRSVGEIGHIVVDKDGPLCSCGKHGCLETLINMPSLLETIAHEPQRRLDILRHAGSVLGKAISMPVGMLGFSRVVVVGDPYVVNQVFVDAMQQELNADIAADFREPVAVMRSMIGDDLSLLGACASVIRDRLHFTPSVNKADIAH